ncbi:hypothetical protein ACMDCR_30400 [Labrys okinawensis]|uniref:hypothetical protein n=1 Tax=Labrys okinawensis TaxID=346911 RepID=UPI0039BD39B1
MSIEMEAAQRMPANTRVQSKMRPVRILAVAWNLERAHAQISRRVDTNSAHFDSHLNNVAATNGASVAYPVKEKKSSKSAFRPPRRSKVSGVGNLFLLIRALILVILLKAIDQFSILVTDALALAIFL